MLHRVIETCGLADCGDLVALTTPDQLQRVFDLDLWRPARPGLDEQFDPDRFALWLDVLMESGAPIAAQKLAGVDADLVIAALARHVLVIDGAAASPFTTLDGDQIAPRRDSGSRLTCEIGGYRLEARRDAAWDAIVDLLLSLDAEHQDYFHRVMSGCRRLSNSAPEVDGLDDLLSEPDQDMFDLAVERERRREQQGFVTAAQGRAFLQSAREIPLGPESGLSAPSAFARAYFRAMDSADAVEPTTAESGSPDPPPGTEDAVAAVVGVLRDAGVLPGQPRALLTGEHGVAPRHSRIQAMIQSAHERDPAAYSTRTEELAYLANALVAGCSIQARPFTAAEASDAAASICNLGLESWPRNWTAGTDLIAAFQVGWRVLYADVCLFAAERLIAVLRDLRCGDRDIQSGLDALRFDLTGLCRAGTPWRARDALDVIAILDMPAWTALLGLIDECPVEHAAIGATRKPGTRSFNASSFEFISERSQIASIHEFMESLPRILSS